MAQATEGKRHILNMRTTKQLREALESAARVHGRSLSQEAEYRLEKSFAQDGIIQSMFNNPGDFPFLRTLSTALSLIQRATGKTWGDDPETRRQCQFAIKALSYQFLGLDRSEKPLKDDAFEAKFAGLEKDSGQELGVVMAYHAKIASGLLYAPAPDELGLLAASELDAAKK